MRLAQKQREALPALAEGELGPCMRALTPRMQRYVQAMLEVPDCNYTRAAAIAGYSQESEKALRVTAHRLAHDPRIQAAIQEEAQARIGAAAILAASNLVEIAGNPMHKDRFKATIALLNRAGLHEKTEHKVTVAHLQNDEQAIAKVKSLAVVLGLDPKRLLGQAGIVDAAFEDITPGPDGTEGLEDLL